MANVHCELSQIKLFGVFISSGSPVLVFVFDTRMVAVLLVRTVAVVVGVVVLALWLSLAAGTPADGMRGRGGSLVHGLAMVVGLVLLVVVCVWLVLLWVIVMAWLFTRCESERRCSVVRPARDSLNTFCEG